MANPNENTGRWSNEEHDVFINGLREHGKEWKVIAALVETRTVVQIRTHAQKYFQKLSKRGITDPVGYIRRGNATPFDGVKRPRDAEPRTPRKSQVSSPHPHRTRRPSSDASGDSGASHSPTPRSKLGRSARRQALGVAQGEEPVVGGATAATTATAAAAAAAAPQAAPRAFHAVQEHPGTVAADLRHPTASTTATKGVKRRHGALAAAPRAGHRPRVMHSSRPPPPRRLTLAAPIPLVEVAPVPEQAPPSTTFVRLPVLNDYAGSAREYGVDTSYPIPDDALLVSAAPRDGRLSDLLAVGDASPTSVCDVLYSFPVLSSSKPERASPLMSVPDALAGSWLGGQDSYLTNSEAVRCATYPASAGHGPVKRQRTSYAAASAQRKGATFALDAHDFDVDEYVEGFLAPL